MQNVASIAIIGAEALSAAVLCGVSLLLEETFGPANFLMTLK